MAFGPSTITDLGGAASDLFAGMAAQTQAQLKAQGLDIQAQGELAESQNYDLAGNLAAQNAKFTDLPFKSSRSPGRRRSPSVVRHLTWPVLVLANPVPRST
jgi:hypothetical protein